MQRAPGTITIYVSGNIVDGGFFSVDSTVSFGYWGGTPTIFNWQSYNSYSYGNGSQPEFELYDMQGSVINYTLPSGYSIYVMQYRRDQNTGSSMGYFLYTPQTDISCTVWPY